MPIKKRSTVPDPAVEASEHQDEKHHARHPYLSGLRQDVYMFVGANPNVTRRDVAKGLDLPNNVATARIKELIDEGFLVEPPGVRKENPSGVRAKTLVVSDRPMGGKPLDRVRIEIALTIDYKGVYGAAARVVGGERQHGVAHPIMTKRITVTAPHPDSYKSLTDAETVTTVSRLDTQLHAGDIIDADGYSVDD